MLDNRPVGGSGDVVLLSSRRSRGKPVSAEHKRVLFCRLDIFGILSLISMKKKTEREERETLRHTHRHETQRETERETQRETESTERHRETQRDRER